MLSVAWSDLAFLLLGSSLPPSAKSSSPFTGLWSCSIGACSVGLSSVCAWVSVCFGVGGSTVGFISDEVSVGCVGVGRQGGCGCGFLSVRRIL